MVRVQYSGIIFPNVFYSRLVESMDEEPTTDTAGQLYLKILNKNEKISVMHNATMPGYLLLIFWYGYAHSSDSVPFQSFLTNLEKSERGESRSLCAPSNTTIPPLQHTFASLPQSVSQTIRAHVIMSHISVYVSCCKKPLSAGPFSPYGTDNLSLTPPPTLLDS